MRVIPLALAPAQERPRRLPVGRAGVFVADVDGEKFKEAPGSPLPCSCYQCRHYCVCALLKRGAHALPFGFVAVRRVQTAAHVVTANCASSKVGSLPSFPCLAPASEAYP